jgi:cytochrome b561
MKSAANCRDDPNVTAIRSGLLSRADRIHWIIAVLASFQLLLGDDMSQEGNGRWYGRYANR